MYFNIWSIYHLGQDTYKKKLTQLNPCSLPKYRIYFKSKGMDTLGELGKGT